MHIISRARAITCLFDNNSHTDFFGSHCYRRCKSMGIKIFSFMRIINMNISAFFYNILYG